MTERESKYNDLLEFLLLYDGLVPILISPYYPPIVDWNTFIIDTQYYLYNFNVPEGLISKILGEPELLFTLYFNEITDKKTLNREIDSFFKRKK